MEDFPSLNEMKKEIEQAVKDALNVEDVVIRKPEGGTNNRTFIIEAEGKEFIAHTEEQGGLQLRRAYNAQRIAEERGVKVAHVVAHNFNNSEGDLWIVEDKASGKHFNTDEMDEEEVRTTAIDLGKQFKTLHEVRFDRFGLIPPYPYRTYAEWEEANPEEVKKSEALTGPVYATFEEYKAREVHKLVQAGELAEIDASYIEQAKALYDELEYTNEPKFCGGDTRTTNVLVKDGRVQAIIDWEWAHGGDPASHVGSWSAWNDDSKYLDYFLEGYQPEDILHFKRKVSIYEIIDTVSTILAFRDMNNEKGIENTKTKFERLMRNF